MEEQTITINVLENLGYLKDLLNIPIFSPFRKSPANIQVIRVSPEDGKRLEKIASNVQIKGAFPDYLWRVKGRYGKLVPIGIGKFDIVKTTGGEEPRVNLVYNEEGTITPPKEKATPKMEKRDERNEFSKKEIYQQLHTHFKQISDYYKLLAEYD
jgi:hypothetical protein